MLFSTTGRRAKRSRRECSGGMLRWELPLTPALSPQSRGEGEGLLADCVPANGVPADGVPAIRAPRVVFP